jgi:hypothetical protein
MHEGFTYEYKSSCSEIGRWLSLFHSLAFLYADDVADACAFDIMDCAPTSDKTDKFADYFCSTTAFPPSVWAEISSDVHRTNIRPESFHRHICSQFISPNPMFCLF